MISLLIKAILAYMLGSVSGSLVLGSLRHVDIRKSGSGNAGGTNAFRTQGLRFALAVVLIDIGKGFLAAWLIPQLELNIPVDSVPAAIQVLVCGFAAILGHCFPLWHGFRGGKGAATAVGALLMIQAIVLIPLITTWILVLLITGWVGLATMLAAVSVIPTFYWLGASSAQMVFALALALFMIFTHRSNIRNMLGGVEYRFERIRIKNWFG
jgi:glycerol-3-phosphate acyltransferase PlsY